LQEIFLAISRGDDGDAARLIRGLRPTRLNEKIDHGDALVHLAIRGGLLETVQALYEAGANLELLDGEGQTPLINAIQHKQAALLDFLIDRVSVNTKNSEGRCALHMAVLEEYLEGIDKLLASLLTDPNQQDGFGESPLHYAVKYIRNPEVIRRLLKHWDLDPTTLDLNGQSALHRAVELNDIGAIQVWRELSNLNIPDGFKGDTPLHKAIELGLQEMAQALIAGGANPYMPNLGGITPDELAQTRGMSLTLSSMDVD
jgi:ankyrin repeat protein